MNRVLLSALCCIVTVNLYAQLTTKELPYGLKGVQAHKQNTITLTAPDKERIEKEDLINDQQPGPVRYAYPVWVNYTLENSGVWEQLDDGSKIWRLKVNIPGALSTNTYYDKFWLPEGGKFFVYSEDTEQSIGAITSDFIGGSKEKPIEFATALIYGENVVYEYYQPVSVKESAIISISRIDYGYRYVDNPYKSTLRNFGDAKNCNININCPKGSNWQTEKRAVAKVSTYGPNGSGWCSCALINNTSNDYTPYVLTANHCLQGLDALGNRNASLWMFYWDYEHSGCSNSSTEPTQRTSIGATLEANNSDVDFALLRLTEDPQNVSGFTPYYLGWDRSGSENVYQGAGIHHPRGDVKKISLISWVTNYPEGITWQDDNGNTLSTTPPNTHWGAIIYKGDGFIENGSSGSPLLNDNGRVIGQLHGGSTKLPNGVDVGCDIFDYYGGYYNWFYGRFDVSWTGNNSSNSRRRLKDWLDPNGLNTSKTLNGIAASGSGVGFYDYVTIQDPEYGRSGLFISNPLSPNTYVIEPCSTANFHAVFVSGSTPKTYPVTFDWFVILYRPDGTEYVYAQQTGISPNTYNSYDHTYGCYWQFSVNDLPSDWSYDPTLNICGKVTVVVHIDDEDTKSDNIEIGVVPIKIIQNMIYSSNETINACSDIKLTDVQIQGTPTITFNMNEHDITIDEAFEMPVGATFIINP